MPKPSSALRRGFLSTEVADYPSSSEVPKDHERLGIKRPSLLGSFSSSGPRQGMETKLGIPEDSVPGIGYTGTKTLRAQTWKSEVTEKLVSARSSHL